MLLAVYHNLIHSHQESKIKVVKVKRVRINSPQEVEILLDKPIERGELIDLILKEYEETYGKTNSWVGIINSEAGTPRGMTFYDHTVSPKKNTPLNPERTNYLAMNPGIEELAHPTYCITYLIRPHLWGPENDLLIIPQNSIGDFTNSRDYPKLLPVLRSLENRTLALDRK